MKAADRFLLMNFSMLMNFSTLSLKMEKIYIQHFCLLRKYFQKEVKMFMIHFNLKYNSKFIFKKLNILNLKFKSIYRIIILQLYILERINIFDYYKYNIHLSVVHCIKKSDIDISSVSCPLYQNFVP